MTRSRIEPAASRSRSERSATEPPLWYNAIGRFPFFQINLTFLVSGERFPWSSSVECNNYCSPVTLTILKHNIIYLLGIPLHISPVISHDSKIFWSKLFVVKIGIVQPKVRFPDVFLSRVKTYMHSARSYHHAGLKAIFCLVVCFALGQGFS